MTETDFMRYVYKLGDKDYSLVNGMVPLGSCTMKLNAAVQLEPLSWESVTNVHPFLPREYVEGYLQMIEKIGDDLKNIKAIHSEVGLGKIYEKSTLKNELISFMEEKGFVVECCLPNDLGIEEDIVFINKKFLL